jgi:hypothetical protein
MMKTSDIDRILRRNLVTAPFYLGCFAADRIPISPPHYPHCMVVNTDPGWAKGAHWVSIYCLSPTHVEYFDSLGIWAPPSEPICTFLSRFQWVRFVSRPVQSPYTDTCGKHAIFFLYHRCSGVPMERIISRMLLGKHSADSAVTEFVREKIFAAA